MTAPPLISRLLHNLLTIIEGHYQDEAIGALAPGGWWVYPDGTIEPLPEAGLHGVVAQRWLHEHDAAAQTGGDAVAAMIAHGGVRVRVSHRHGEELNVMLDSHRITTLARQAVLQLLEDTIDAVDRYWMVDSNPHRCSYHQVTDIISGRNVQAPARMVGRL